MIESQHEIARAVAARRAQPENRRLPLVQHGNEMHDAFAGEIRDRERAARDVVDGELVAHVAQRQVANGARDVAQRKLRRVS